MIAPQPFDLQSAAFDVAIDVHGTLVVCVPCREGLIVVADRRSTLQGEHVDGAMKLDVLAGSPATATAVTGTGEFIDEPPSGETAASWHAKAPRRFDAQTVLKRALEAVNRRLDAEMLGSSAESVD